MKNQPKSDKNGCQNMGLTPINNFNLARNQQFKIESLSKKKTEKREYNFLIINNQIKALLYSMIKLSIIP